MNDLHAQYLYQKIASNLFTMRLPLCRLVRQKIGKKKTILVFREYLDISLT
jgi:hypothetical protein